MRAYVLLVRTWWPLHCAALQSVSQLTWCMHGVWLQSPSAIVRCRSPRAVWHVHAVVHSEEEVVPGVVGIGNSYAQRCRTGCLSLTDKVLSPPSESLVTPPSAVPLPVISQVRGVCDRQCVEKPRWPVRRGWECAIRPRCAPRSCVDRDCEVRRGWMR